MLPFYEVQEPRIRDGDRLRPSFYFPAHLHVECEMIWVRRGYMRMRADEIAYTIGEGEVFLIAPNEVHAYDSSSADVEGRLLMFHPEEVGASSLEFAAYKAQASADCGAGGAGKALGRRLTGWKRRGMRTVNRRCDRC